MDTPLIRTFSIAASVPVLTCCRRSDSRAREKNSRRKKIRGKTHPPRSQTPPPKPPTPVFAVLRWFLFQVAVLRFYKTKRFEKFSGNFIAVCGFLMLFCAVFTRISVRFCGIGTPITPPSNTVISHTFAYSSRWRRKPWQGLLWKENLVCLQNKSTPNVNV